MQTQYSVSLHSDAKGKDLRVLIACVNECTACAQACTSCADACMSEQMIEHLRRCMRLNLDCADVCRMTADICARRTGSNPDVLKAALVLCAVACESAHEECARHGAAHGHCRACAESCRVCADACREALGFIGSGDGISGTGMQTEFSWIHH